eukprot:scaffold162272_cov20-Tisochrysis_lutea.AAC.2
MERLDGYQTVGGLLGAAGERTCSERRQVPALPYAGFILIAAHPACDCPASPQHSCSFCKRLLCFSMA